MWNTQVADWRILLLYEPDAARLAAATAWEMLWGSCLFSLNRMASCVCGQAVKWPCSSPLARTLSAPCVKPLAWNTTEMTEISFLCPTANRGRNKYIFLVMAWEVSWDCGWDEKSEGILYKVLALRKAVGRNTLAVEMPQLWYEISSHLKRCIQRIRPFPLYIVFFSLR